MSKLFQHLPWLVAGAALYHLSRTLLEHNNAGRSLLSRHRAELQARNRRFYRLATACQRGITHNN